MSEQMRVGSGLRAVVVRGLTLWAALVVLVWIGGVLSRVRGGPWWAFDLDTELTFAAFVSAGALALAGVSCLVAAWRRPGGVALAVVGAGLLGLSLDELYEIHEQLEARTGVDWQLLYLPVAAAAGIMFLVVARRFRGEPWILGPWVAGAVLWVVSQVLEALQWDGDVPRRHYNPMMVTEELLELAGTGCFTVAAWAIRRCGRPAGAVARARIDA